MFSFSEWGQNLEYLCMWAVALCIDGQYFFTPIQIIPIKDFGLVDYMGWY